MSCSHVQHSHECAQNLALGWSTGTTCLQVPGFPYSSCTALLFPRPDRRGPVPARLLKSTVLMGIRRAGAWPESRWLAEMCWALDCLFGAGSHRRVHHLMSLRTAVCDQALTMQVPYSSLRTHGLACPLVSPLTIHCSLLPQKGHLGS